MKAIITDLDRTLLRTDKTLSGRTLRALAACRRKGLRLMAASARPLRDILPFHAQLHFDAVAASNGAVIDLPGKQLTCGIPRESSHQVLRALLDYPNVFISAETSAGLFSNRDIPAWKPVVYHDFPALPQGAIPYKILASCDDTRLYREIAQRLPGDVYHTVADRKLIQIMHRGASKWHAVCRMLAFYGLSPSDAVYFGDDNDDVEPLQKCGLGVAVANAIPAALAAADAVAPDNDNDGVAAFLEEHLL